MHDTRSFGYTSINLSKAYLKVTAIASTKPISTPSGSSESDAGDEVDIEVEGTSSDAGGGAGVASSTWTHYDTIVFAHAVSFGVAQLTPNPSLIPSCLPQGVALVVWLIISPAAVLIGRLGRHRPSWFIWHSSLQVSRSPSRRAQSLISASTGLHHATSHSYYRHTRRRGRSL